MVQMFTMPFSWQVWTTLIFVFSIAEIIHLMFPDIFLNDPILLVICGYEKYDLHRAEFKEKLFMISLIVLMFFATCAYETKLLSMMTSKPASKDIRTVQELVESGIKILVDARQSFDTPEFYSVRDLLEPGIFEVTDLDMVHAYFYPREQAQYLASLSYDPNQRMYRYVALDDMYSVGPVSFMFSRRSPLMEIFRFTQTVLIESGIYNFAVTFLKVAARKFVALKFDGSFDSDVLYFADFQPVWRVLLLGSAASESDFKRYERYLKVLSEHEVVFIDVKRHRMIITDNGKHYLAEPSAPILVNCTVEFFPAVLVNGTVDFLNLDLVHAYFLQNTIAKLLASRYYDPDQRIHRYVVLDESYTVEPIAFVLGKRSPLKRGFRVHADDAGRERIAQFYRAVQHPT
ncbi:hypothetical protein pipiens_006986 [Culex pipiens pipiens]|uniref:Uncharacterized protein n=1 Tax=Culex pipiens pipiens TaxID=38569 RepID=A0ABD1DMV5_CULPP